MTWGDAGFYFPYSLKALNGTHAMALAAKHNSVPVSIALFQISSVPPLTLVCTCIEDTSTHCTCTDE